MKTKSIGIKINNPNDKPEEGIRNGCISISEIDPHGKNKPYKGLEDKNGKFHGMTQLGVGDYIYVYEVKNKLCLLTYKIDI